MKKTRFSKLLILAGLLMLGACGGRPVDEVYYAKNVSAPCSNPGSVDADGSVRCTKFLKTKPMRVLLRVPDSECPVGGVPWIWGTTEIHADGTKEVTEIHYGCVLSCGDQDDCPSGSTCTERHECLVK